MVFKMARFELFGHLDGQMATLTKMMKNQQIRLLNQGDYSFKISVSCDQNVKVKNCFLS